MRLITLALLIFISSFALAQMPAGMQEAVDCMQSLDQEALEDMGKQGEKIGNEIEALCKKGDESGAREVAMEYIEGIEDNEAIEELKRCTEMMRKVMPNMPIPEIPSAEMYEEEADSICENTD
jgi:hypothetical protein